MDDQPKESSAKSEVNEPYTVGAVTNAIRLLEMIGKRGELRVFEAADVLGVARSSAHRLLSTLRGGGFVEQNPATRGYRIGSKFVSIAMHAFERMDIRRIAQPHLDRLRDEIGETVHLMCLDGDNVRFVAGAECSHMLRVGLQIGTAIPALDTAGGKAILMAQKSPEHLLDPTTKERLFVTHFRQNTDVIGVGTALRRLINVPPSAVAMAAPKGRMPPERVATIAQRVLLTAQAIEDEVADYRSVS